MGNAGLPDIPKSCFAQTGQSTAPIPLSHNHLHALSALSTPGTMALLGLAGLTSTRRKR